MSEHRTYMLTAAGGGRSGKGTSMEHLRGRLEAAHRQVGLIDQGQKFRAMAKAALGASEPLDSPNTLNDFLQSAAAKGHTLAILDEVSTMNGKEKKAFLYAPEVSEASAKVGAVPSAHEIATTLLRSEVEIAVEDQKDIILIDGRSVEKYARRFDAEGLARFTMGWFFTCDPAIAARRSLGLFGDIDKMTPEQREQLLRETFRISDRNRADTLRDIDPMHEPPHAYRLDLAEYGTPGSDVRYKRGYDILRSTSAMATVDTSYTNSVEEMIGPVADISMMVLFHRGALVHEDVGIQVVRRA